jgi:hypothetical protein
VQQNNYAPNVYTLYWFLCDVAGHERTPRSWPCRLVYLTAYLTAVVLFAAYSATFISFLAVRHSPLPFKTFEEILQDGTYKLGILDHSVELNFFDVSVTLHIFNITLTITHMQ